MFEPLECPFLPRLEALWDGELTGEPAEALLQHLDDCAPCAAAHRAEERLTRLLRAEDPPSTLSAGAIQRIRGELLQRAADSLVAESPREVVLPRGGRSRFRMFFALGSALAAAVWIAHWNRPWQPQQSPPSVMSKTGLDEQSAEPHRKIEVQPLTPKRHLDSPVPQRMVDSQAPRSAIPDTVFAPVRKPVVVSVAETTQRPTFVTHPSQAVAEAPAAAPKTERVVIDLSGPAAPSRPEAGSLTLIANGSPDSPGGEIAVIRIDGPEKNP